MLIFLIDRVIQQEGLDSQLDPAGPTRGVLKQEFWDLRWKFLFINGCYICYLLFIILLVAVGYRADHWSGTSMHQIEFSHIAYKRVWVALI